MVSTAVSLATQRRSAEIAAFERSLTPAPRRRPAARIGSARPGHVVDPKHGFASHSEFLKVVMAAFRGGQIDERLAPLAAAGADEQSTFADPYGGFLVPKGFSPQLLSTPSEADPVAGRCTKVPMEAGEVSIPARVDKDHSTSVSGGLQVYRRAEGDSVSSTRMAFEKITLTAHSLFGLAHATEELLSRSPMSFIALLEAGFADEFGAKLLDERLNGTGVGQYEGVNTSPALITVPKEAGQAAATIVYENIVGMRSRCWGYRNAIWLANHNTLPQLMQLTIDVGTGGVPVWQPSAREDAPDLLLGRPIYFSEFTQTLGTAGDIVLCNWSQYLEGTLTPLQSAESLHVRFINHERTFKFWLENGGAPWWRSALTPRNGSTLSPFVRLATRA